MHRVLKSFVGHPQARSAAICFIYVRLAYLIHNGKANRLASRDVVVRSRLIFTGISSKQTNKL